MSPQRASRAPESNLNTTALFGGASTNGGAGLQTQAFGAATTDTDVVKVSSVGFVTTTTSTQAANLNFDVAVVDGDGDQTNTQTLANVQIAGGTTFAGGVTSEFIQGGSGNDFINGGTGSDLLTGACSWVWIRSVFNTALDPQTNVDLITDFTSGTDKLSLENTGAGLFNALSTGVLAANALDIVGAADANTRIIYDPVTGALSYDFGRSRNRRDPVRHAWDFGPSGVV